MSKTEVGNRASPISELWSPGRAQVYRDSRDRAESHWTRFLGQVRFQPDFWKIIFLTHTQLKQKVRYTT